jgi:hypothetical protein
LTCEGSRSLNVHGTPFDHPVFLQIAFVLVNLRHFPCGAEDSRPQLASASGKEGARMIKGVEDHVKFAAITLNTALEVVSSKGESALFRKERRGEVFVESSATQCRFAQSRRRRLCGSLLSQL